jgi:hypothetical protein
MFEIARKHSNESARADLREHFQELRILVWTITQRKSYELEMPRSKAAPKRSTTLRPVPEATPAVIPTLKPSDLGRANGVSKVLFFHSHCSLS